MSAMKSISMFVRAAAAGLLAAACARGGDDGELRLWRDPRFQRQFLGTYGAQAEIEPRVTAVEKEQMEKIMPLLGAKNGLPAARKLLAQAATPAASAVFDFTCANVCFQQNDLDSAAAWYAKAVAKFSSFLRAHKNLGIVEVRAGRFDKAVPALTRAIDLGAGDGLTYGMLGYAYMQTERYASAENAYRLAAMLQPETMDWRLGLARCLFKIAKYEEAAALCEEMIRTDPGRAEYRMLQANAFLGMKQPTKAAENYELLDLAGQSTVESLNTLGDIQVNEGCMDIAADAYLRAMQKDTKGDAAKFVRNAEVLAARGAHAEAERVVARIREVFEGKLDDSARKRLLKLAVRMAASRGAARAGQMRLLEEIVELDPLDGEALILLGQQHASAGDIEKAALLFERAAAIEKCEADARLRHAQCLVRNARYADALPLLKRAQELRPREDVGRYQEQVERMARMKR